MPSKFHFKSLRSWLTLWFLLLALSPVMISGGVTYYQRVEAIKLEAYAKLTAIRDLKVAQLEVWLDNRIADFKQLSGNLQIFNIAKMLRNSPLTGEDLQHVKEAKDMLHRFVESSSDYAEVFIVDAADGKIILSSNPASEGLYRKTDEYFTQAISSNGLHIKDIYFSEALNAASMAFSIPIFAAADRLSIDAILVARIDLKDSIYKLLLTRTGLGESGETLIVNKDGLALNELRWHQDAPLNLIIKAQPAVLASQGNEGVLEVDDYRGKKVLAAYRHIPRLNWGFVAKQDSEEAFAPIKKLLSNLLIIFVLSAGGIVLCAFAVARRIVAPITTMKEVAARQQQGELTVRNQVQRSDELGFLAQVFNDLAGSVEMQLQIQGGNNDVINSIVGADSLNEFCKALLNKMLEISDSQVAAFYLYNETNQTFELQTSIGLSADCAKSFAAESLEGEFGVALASKRIERIQTIPEDTRFLFNAVAGQAVPREIITIPLMDRREVKAVVSLASLTGYSDVCLEILDMCWLPISTGLTTFIANDKTLQLALKLAEKNEALQHNTEELQSQSEELREQADELRETACELESRRVQVEEADRLKSEFLSNMSHELRTPLNSVLALSQLMIARGTGKNPDEEKNFLEVIERNGRQLLSLINDILDLAKIESGRMDIFLTNFFVEQTARRALDTIQPLADNKGLVLTFHSDEAIEISSDDEKINQILLNLLSNAVKFTDHGEIDLQVSRMGQSVVFVVRDTGIGIGPEDLAHVFDEFRQVDGTTTRQHEGTGLGLAICQKLAGLLGGRILAESTHGEGSTFTLELPLGLSALEPRPEQAASLERKTGKDIVSDSSLSRTVLVIDDELEVRQLMNQFLTSSGYEVIMAADGQEGLRLAKQIRPFAITLDVLMPEMDGWETLKLLKADPTTTQIPVVMLSVIADNETGVALGADGHLVKPVDKNALYGELEKIGGSCQPLARDTNLSARAERPKILVVEDNETAALQICTILEGLDYEVRLASGGAEGLESVKQSVPDAMVLDLMMPDVDGFEVLETIRSTSETEQLPVLVLTAKALTTQDRARLKNNHIHQLIQKGSVNREQLSLAVRSLLESCVIEPSSVGTQPEITKSQAKNRTILIVEDNPDNLLTITSTLSGENCKILTAINGQQGVEMAEKNHPGLILMDMQLPVMNGVEATRRIKENPTLSEIPIIALTANAMKGDRESMLAAGCSEYLSKPFDPAELLLLVRKKLH